MVHLLVVVHVHVDTAVPDLACFRRRKSIKGASQTLLHFIVVSLPDKVAHLKNEGAMFSLCDMLPDQHRKSP